MKVLFADDSLPIRERMVSRLSRIPDVKVAEAVDTPDALRQMAVFQPDVAILDIRMPGGGGVKALREIKKHTPDTTVIIMTNYPYAEYRRKCLDAGADFFFDKSTEFELLAETIFELTKTENVSEVAHRTAAVQLVRAKEEQEKARQQKYDMNLLSLMLKPGAVDDLGQAYTLWERTFDAIPDLVVIFDADYRIVRANKMMADRLGVPAAELTGKKCFKYMHGTDCPVSGCPHELMLHDEKEHQVEMYNEPLNAWLDISVSPVFANGKLIGAIHVARDITERKRAEGIIKASESRYRQLFESMQSGFALHEIICDEKGVPCDYRFLEVNPAFEKMTGRRAIELVGKTVRELMPTTERYWIETYGKVALTGEPIWIDEFSGELGRYFSVSAYSPKKGQFATVFSDITNQRNAEAAVNRARIAAEEANQAKTQFLANMSHELRTPLNAIIGFTDLLKGSNLDDEQLDFIKTIGASGEAMLTLVQDLFDFSKIEMGKIQLNNRLFNIREVINQVIEELSPVAKDKGLTLECIIDSAVPEKINTDIDRLRQILVNLINNAIKFTDEGFVRLTVQSRTVPSGGCHIKFEVEDSGIGISENVLGLIFRPFQQGDNSSTRSHGGSGLGLAISKNLVELMGGDLCVESRQGKGSLFSFYIADRTDPEIKVSIDEVREKWRGRSICVWDDSPANLRVVENMLERCGIFPRYAETVDAINNNLIHEVTADAVLCNLDMPGLKERLAEFRAIKPDIPWIGFSRWSEPLDISVKNYFMAFIDHPLRAEQLYTAFMRLAEKA